MRLAEYRLNKETIRQRAANHFTLNPVISDTTLRLVWFAIYNATVPIPEEQEEFLQFGRFGQASPERQRRLLRRRWRAFLFLLALGLASVIVLRLLSTAQKIVLQEERTLPGNVRCGFAVQQARFGSILKTGEPFGIIVHLWTHDAKGTYEDIQINTPRLRPTKIKQHQWLVHNQALLLGMDTEIDLGSYTEPEQRWVLYNFRSGELRTCNTFLRQSCADLQAYARTLEE